jgi:putative phage-type endonuclease
MESTEKQGPLAPYHDEKEWLEARRSGIGASEVAAILGVEGCPFDERDVYFSKVLGEEQKQTRYMRRGRVLEAPAADLYQEETGRKLRRMPLVRHKDLPILFADLDRQILAGEDNPTAGLEIKVPAMRNYLKIRKEGILPHWLIQAQVQKMVTGYPFIAFGIFNADAWEIMTHDFTGIPAMEERILERVDKWWTDHIVAGVPPAPKLETPIELPGVEVDTEIVTRNDQPWLDAVALLLDAKEVLEEAKGLDKVARDRIKNLLRDANQRVAEGGGVRVYLNQKPGRMSFQKKELAAVRPVSREALINDLQVRHHMPLSAAEKLADECALDLTAFEKQGRAYEELRPYFLKGDV